MFQSNKLYFLVCYELDPSVSSNQSICISNDRKAKFITRIEDERSYTSAVMLPGVLEEVLETVRQVDARIGFFSAFLLLVARCIAAARISHCFFYSMRFDWAVAI